GKPADSLVWTHRADEGFDIYFLSNQASTAKTLNLSLRVQGRLPELWDPLTGNREAARTWNSNKGRTSLPVRLEPGGSVFVVFQTPTAQQSSDKGKNWIEAKTAQTLTGNWQVRFDTAFGGPAKDVQFSSLTDWRYHTDTTIRYYSGKAVYEKSFRWNRPVHSAQPVWLSLGKVANIAEVFVNGISCGIVWTAPYRVNISPALKKGENQLRIEVINTWNNRMVGDSRLPKEKRIAYTVYPFKIEGKPLLPAGLLGPVTIEVAK
ncbi:MAG TPA: glycosyl hydrolase, partial [Flavisolibacter sp.]|nr:glycosyl hydrolase [Flavisolibacter sp.]